MTMQMISPEAVVRKCSVKKVFLEISQNSHEKQAQACNFIKKETLVQVFFCEFCEISQNTFSYRIRLVAASVTNELRVTSYYSLYELQVKFIMRVTT